MKSLRLLAILFGLLAFGNGTISAQSDRGTIRGTVTDQNEAVIANAKVILTGIDRNDTREVTTSDNGIFVFPEIKAGLYKITVEATGFKKILVDNIKVDVQGQQTLAIKLEIGQVSDNVVNITAEDALINTDSPVRQTNVTERQVKELPLLVATESGGRTPLAFIFLDSNINSSGNANASATGTSDASRFKISGGQALGTEILIDGASTRRSQNGTFFTEVAPGPNAFQEFTVSTSLYSAEFGNSSGGIVNFTLKSGSNEFHGEVYDLLRNEKLNSNSFNNKVTGTPRSRDNQNDFGFNLGGPIYIPEFGEGGPMVRSLKDRAFFFFNYEGYRFRQGENVIVTVPTARMRTGDFGELLTDPQILAFFGGPVRIYDPRLPSNIRPAIPGNRLDLVAGLINGRPLIDPAGLAILQRFPLPNRPGLFRNYQAQSIRPTNMNQFTAKTDFVLTEKQRLTVSYSQRDQTAVKGGFQRFPEPFVAQGVWDQTFSSKFVRVQHDYTITSNLLNHLNLGYTFYDVANRNFTDPFNTSSLGIPANATQNVAFPRVGFPGYGDFITSGDPRAYQDIGSTFFTDRIKDQGIDIGDSVTFVMGRHTFKFGGSVRLSQFNIRQKIDPGGTFNFRHDQTASDADGNGGYPIASLITGATEFAFNFNNSIDPAFRQMTQSYFIQDDFKLTQKLTLNLGLRYDLPELRVEARDRFRGFDPTAPNPEAGGRRGALVTAGQGGVSRSLAENDKTNFGPRIGAAYAFNNKTVVRGGFGIYFAPILYGIDGGNDLNTGLLGYNSGALFTPAGRNANFFLSTFPSIPPVAPNGQFIGGDVQFFDDQFRTGRTMQWSVDVQRELPWNFVASAGYIGHKADSLRSNFGRLNALPLNALRLGLPILTTNINAVTPEMRTYASSVGVTIPASGNAVFTGFNGTVAQALKPFPQYNRINNILESEGENRYDALQIKLQRRFAQGVQFGASYSYSRLFGNASEDLFGGSPQSGVIQNPFDTESLKTTSPNNPPHVFVTNFLAELPFGKGRKFLDQGGIVNVLVGGWQVAGVFRYQSGTPIVVFSPNNTQILDVAGYFGNFRPNLTGQPIALAATAVGVGRIRVLNIAAFSIPPDYGAAPPFLLANGTVNPAYTAYYSNPNSFFGTAPPVITDFRTDAFFSEDLSILKKTRITETITLELGAEFFNVFNRLRFSGPATDLRDAANFGVKTIVEPFDRVANRVIQLRARVIF